MRLAGVALGRVLALPLPQLRWDDVLRMDRMPMRTAFHLLSTHYGAAWFDEF
jgi:hypothetical protein